MSFSESSLTLNGSFGTSVSVPVPEQAVLVEGLLEAKPGGGSNVSASPASDSGLSRFISSLRRLQT